MKRIYCKKPATVALLFALFFLTAGGVNAQWNSANAYGHSTGYGTVYGSFGLASTMQSMYNVARAQSQRNAAKAVPQGSSSSARSSASSNPQTVLPTPRVARNHGVFRPDATVDTGKAMADALGDTAEDRALIRKIYTSTKASYEEAAAIQGWKSNMAGGLTFFTVAAMTVYHGAGEPSDEAVATYYNSVNASLDEIPGLASVTNKDKQNYNNMLIGFAGILLATYTEGKQTENASTLESSKKLAGMLINMVLKTDPENIRLENGQIVLK